MRLISQTSLWAATVSLAGFCFVSCKNAREKSLSVLGECVNSNDRSLTAFRSNYLSCYENKPYTTPRLYARTLETTLRQEISFLDVVYDTSGALFCPPGPYYIEEGIHHNLPEREWILASAPDYFGWHIENRASLDESFYITNQNGLPVKADILRLQNDSDAIVLLLPKKKLIPGAKYYIYLTQKTAEKNYKWVQPLSTTAKALSR